MKPNRKEIGYRNAFSLSIDSSSNLRLVADRYYLTSTATIIQAINGGDGNVTPIGTTTDTVYKVILKIRDSSNSIPNNYGIGHEGWNKISVYVRVTGESYS